MNEPAPELPECLSVVVCDSHYREEITGKLALVGIFNDIAVAAFPAVHSRLTVYFALTNGNGTYALSVFVEHEDSGELVAEAKSQLTMRNPLAMADVCLTLSNLPLPAHGKYWIGVRINGELIRQRPIRVVAIEEVGR